VIQRTVQSTRSVILGLCVLAAAAWAPEVSADNLKAQLRERAAREKRQEPTPAHSSFLAVPKQADLHNRWGGVQLDLRWFKPGTQPAWAPAPLGPHALEHRSVVAHLPPCKSLLQMVRTAWPHGPPLSL
jgi:hypothetical protein